jgi:hypothetical protein
MPTPREKALHNLFLCLKDELPKTIILRNETLPVTIPNTGLVMIRDGEINNLEFILSPLQYVHQHKVQLEVMVQHVKAERRDYELEILLEEIAIALAKKPTLDGAVDFMHVDSLEFITEAIDGAASIKAARMSLYLEYVGQKIIN